MNREDIMAIARQVGYPIQHEEWRKATEEFAALVEAKAAAAEREVNSKTRAGKPRQLPRLGMGMLHREQQHCFEMGWKEGAAAVRAAIRARGQA